MLFRIALTMLSANLEKNRLSNRLLQTEIQLLLLEQVPFPSMIQRYWERAQLECLNIEDASMMFFQTIWMHYDAQYLDFPSH